LLQLLNIGLQLTIVFEVNNTIAGPTIAHAQHLYDAFTEHCYEGDAGDYTYNIHVREQFMAWEGCDKVELCQYPLASPKFFFCILLVWTFVLVHEVKQTVLLTWHLLALDRPIEGSVTISEQPDQFVITHMSRGLKCWVAASVFVPKYVIAATLWYIGARWLTATAGIDNLVLNALALTFICEVDELIYQTCISEATKSSLQRTKLPLPAFKYAPTLWNPIEAVCTCLCCVALVIFYVVRLQDVLPEYRWDLKHVCANPHHLLGVDSGVCRRAF
jgi:hypothetical protein